MDYSFWDHRKEFRLTDIPFLWCDHEPVARIPENIDGRWHAILNELQTAIRKRELKAKKASNSRHDVIIDRSHLEEWAEGKGEKPKFLFKEERRSSARPRASQRHRQSCRAIAESLWARDPKITIADMICKDEINQGGCEDHLYRENTLRGWIKDLCPNRSAGRRPKQ